MFSGSLVLLYLFGWQTSILHLHDKHRFVVLRYHGCIRRSYKYHVICRYECRASPALALPSIFIATIDRVLWLQWLSDRRVQAAPYFASRAAAHNIRNDAKSMFTNPPEKCNIKAACETLSTAIANDPGGRSQLECRVKSGLKTN